LAKINREQQKAMFAKLGIGAKVELTKKFGIGDVPIGTEGIVDAHVFGRNQPSVKFPQGRFIVDANKLKVIKGSRKFVARNTTEIVAKGTKEQLIKKAKEEGLNINVSDDGSFTGVIHLDDGEGHEGDAFFTGKIKDGGADVKLNQSDIPNRWRFAHDNLTEQAIEMVADAIGVEEP